MIDELAARRVKNATRRGLVVCEANGCAATLDAKEAQGPRVERLGWYVSVGTRAVVLCPRHSAGLAKATPAGDAS